MEAWYSKRNETGLNLSAKDLTNKVFISITNNDTVMWYTMHIFYILFYVPAVSTHIILCLITVSWLAGSYKHWFHQWLEAPIQFPFLQ